MFGAARILGGDSKGAADFFQIRLARAGGANKQWLRWYYGFSQVLAGKFDPAETEFKALAAESNDAIIAALSAYFLATTLMKYSLAPAECRAGAEAAKSRIVQAIASSAGWKKETAKVATEIHAVIIKKYIDEAGDWLFA